MIFISSFWAYQYNIFHHFKTTLTLSHSRQVIKSSGKIVLNIRSSEFLSVLLIFSRYLKSEGNALHLKHLRGWYCDEPEVRTPPTCSLQNCDDEGTVSRAAWVHPLVTNWTTSLLEMFFPFGALQSLPQTNPIIPNISWREQKSKSFAI